MATSLLCSLPGTQREEGPQRWLWPADGGEIGAAASAARVWQGGGPETVGKNGRTTAANSVESRA
ncbi:hypothetical protein THAOC_00258, partial [Thalassiosira oceanica]